MWTHTLHVCRCTQARTSGSDLDHWRSAISGPGSMHHSLVTTDLQESFYFNYSLCNRQHRGYNLCSNISKLYSSSASAGECRRRGSRQLTTVPTTPFGPTINFQIHLFTSWKPSVWFNAPTPINTTLTCYRKVAAVYCQRWQMGLE